MRRRWEVERHGGHWDVAAAMEVSKQQRWESGALACLTNCKPIDVQEPGALQGVLLAGCGSVWGQL